MKKLPRILVLIALALMLFAAPVVAAVVPKAPYSVTWTDGTASFDKLQDAMYFAATLDTCEPVQVVERYSPRSWTVTRTCYPAVMD